MGRYKLHYDELGACEICDHCIEANHPLYFCGCGNSLFGQIDYPEECDDFEYCDDEDEED